MAQPRARITSVADVDDLKDSVKEVFPAVLGKLETALKSESRIFPSGIELIKLTLKVGTNIEFSIIIAGKDAPLGRQGGGGIDAREPSARAAGGRVPLRYVVVRHRVV